MKTIDSDLGTVRVIEPGDSSALARSVLDLLDTYRGPVSWDTETTGLDIYADDFRVRLLQVGGANQAFVIPIGVDDVLDTVARDVLTHRRTVWAHNRVYDCLAVERQLGVPFHVTMGVTADTGILSRVLDPRGPDKGGVGHALKALCEARLGLDVKDARAEVVRAGRQYKIKAADIWRDIPLEDETYLRYAGQDVLLTSRLADTLARETAERGLTSLVKFEHQLDYALAHLQRRGMRLDVGYTEGVRARYLAELDQLEAELADKWEIGGTGQYRHKAKADLIERFKSTGVRWEWFTDKGNEKLDAAVLSVLSASNAPEVQTMARLVESAQQARHYGLDYAGGFLEALGYDGRVHPMINPLAAATGRMSISNPPLQQIPKDDETIRGCFTADEGEVLVGADFAQVEYRVAAGVADDKAMKAAIAAGDDLHANVARTLFGDNWQKEHRDLAKAAGFGRLYGAGVATIARSAGVDQATAKKAADAFDTTYPAVRQYAKRLAAQVEAGNTNLKTVTGRPLIIDPNRGYATINYMIQSPARDVFAAGILQMAESGLLDMLRLVVHDEVILSVPESDAAEVGHEVERCLSRKFLGVPIETEAQVLGPRWTKG